MPRYREVKKYGNSFVISLMKNDLTDLNLEAGDEVDIEGIKKKRGKNE